MESKYYYFLVIALLLLVGIAGATIWDSDGDLEAYWHLDGNGLDHSYNLNNLNISGPTVVDGYYGQAYHFDGVDDNMTFSDINLTEWTITTWIKPDMNMNQVLIAGSYSHYIYYNTLQLFYIVDSGGTHNLFLDGAISTDWQMWTLTYDGTDYHVYINGEIIDLIPSSDAGNYFTVNRLGDDGTHVLNGSLDDYRIYDRALTAAEIGELYNASNISNQIIFKGSPELVSFENDSLQGNHTTTNSSEMLGHWMLDGNALDNTTNNNDGTLGEDVFYSDNCLVGQCTIFDAIGDYVDVGDIDFTGNFSISMWAYSYDWGTNDRFISKGYTNNGNFFIAFYSGSTPRVYMKDSNGNIIDSSNNFDDTELVAGKWYHLVLVYSNLSTVNLYLNGEKDSYTLDASSLTGIFSSGDNIWIGNADDGNDATAFDGAIDEVIIFNRTLSDSEVQEIYNESKDQGSNLVGHWKLNGNALDSGGILHGKNYGNSYFSNKGKFSGAANVYGEGDYIQSTHYYDITPIRNETLSVWFKRLGDGPNAATSEGILCNAVPTLNAQSNIYLQEYGEEINCVMATKNINYGYSTTNEWVHVVCTEEYDNSSGEERVTIYMYVNGELVTGGYKTGVSSYQYISNSILLGVQKTNGHSFFNGLIDDARVYERVLTVDEIKELYNESLQSHKIILRGSPDKEVVEDDLVGYWKMDNNASDLSPYNNDGTVYSETGKAFFGNGKFFKGFQTSGDGGEDNYILVPDSESIEMDGKNMSVSLWFKINNLDDSISYLFARTGRSNVSYTARVGNNGGLLFGGYYSGAGGFNSVTSSGFGIGKWYHAVFIANGTNLNIYINGELNATDSQNPLFPFHGKDDIADLKIGGYGYASAQQFPFDGVIDEFRLYNRTLTDSEIRSLYNESTHSNKFVIRGNIY